METETQILIGRIRKLLVIESAAVRRGDFTALSGLVEEKGRLASALLDTPYLVSADDVARLKSEADATAKILSSAARGIAAARARLESIARVADHLETYDRNGRPQSISLADASVERRS